MRTQSNTHTTLFCVGDAIYYPTHGVGTIVDIDTKTYAGYTAKYYTATFPRDRLKVHIPTTTASQNGLQLIDDFATDSDIKQAYKIIAEPRKKSLAIWNRRASEIEQKLLHGTVLHLAEVIRDTNRDHDEQDENAYSQSELLKRAALRFADIVTHQDNKLQNTDAALADINKRIAEKKRPLPYQYW